MEEEYVIVNKKIFQKLEEARVNLWELLEEDYINNYKFREIPEVIWNVANRKYPEYKGDL